MNEFDEVLATLRSLSNPKNVAGMARFGITTKKALGLSAPQLRTLARKIGTNHNLALQLWPTEILDARILASFIGDPELVTKKLMETWVKDFDNWGICDACCGILFDKTPFAFQKAVEWSRRREEFVKRAGFVLMAESAVHNKEASDSVFRKFLIVIKKESTDTRNFVRKAVNWALRQIGKRNLKLNAAAIRTAKEIHKINSSSAKWIASDALRELTGEAVQARLRKRALSK